MWEKKKFIVTSNFSFFPQFFFFQKTCTADTEKQGLVWERVKGFFPGGGGFFKQEDHDGPISLTWVLNSTG